MPNLGMRGNRPGGSSLRPKLVFVATTFTGVATTLRTSIKGTLTYSKVSGSAALTVNSGTGALTLGSTLANGASASAVIRVQNTIGDAVEIEVTVTGQAAAPAPGPTPPVLTNLDFIGYGDSRTEDGSVTGFAVATGYNPRTQNLGYMGWLASATGNRIRLGRYSNFGIGASTSTEGVQNPRHAATAGASTPGGWWRGRQTATPSSGSGNKGYVQAEAHSAGIGILKFFVNDRAANNWAASWTNGQTILDNTPSMVWIVLNETALGVNDAGGFQNGVASAAFKTFSDRLLTLDYASGHADSRPNVIVVDTFDLSYDDASGANNYNILGFLRDGLHDSPWGARLQSRAINTRMAAVYGSAWTALPSQALMPTANGFANLANTQPFIHSNPILTPGTDGAVQVGVTWNTAPLVTGVPQGWTISGSNVTAINVVCTKGTETDDVGNPVWIIQISGNVAANTTSSVSWNQALANAALTSAFAAGRVSINDAFRGRCKYKITPGSQFLVGFTTQAQVLVNADQKKTQLAIANSGSTVGPGNYLGNGSGSNNRDAFEWDEWIEVVTEMIDQQDANMAANAPLGVPTPLNITSQAEVTQYIYSNVATFRNNTGGALPVSATIRVAMAGMYRCTGAQLHYE